MGQHNPAAYSAAALCLLLLGAQADQDARRDAFVTYTERADCRDRNTACNDWSQKGECTKNPVYMKENCPVSCKECVPEDVDPGAYRGQALVIATSLGDITITPYWDRAPVTAALAMEVAHHGDCQGCNFYRNEALPTSEEGAGPPYGLLQGSLAGMVRVPPKEGGDVAMRRGHVAMIPDTKEFFINLMDHGAWGATMTVWGEVTDMSTVEALIKLPYHDVKHPVYSTIMRMLDSPLEFSLRPLNASASAA